MNKGYGRFFAFLFLIFFVLQGGVVFSETIEVEEVDVEVEYEEVDGDFFEEEEEEIWDPLESGNRLFFDMFMMGYYVAIHPLIGIYNGVTPVFVRDRVDDFAGFLRMPVTLVNDGLQGNGRGFEKTLTRTVKGVPTLGFYDWERDISPRRFEDYGQTAGVYGVPEGPFVAFPLAPTTRDTTMYIAQSLFLDPLIYVVGGPLRFGFLGLRLTSLFSNIDRGMTTVYRSVDGYGLSRDLFMRLRRKALEERGEDEKELEEREEGFELDIDEDLLLDFDEEGE
jgi:phospholipid-binding lipoprotein MlaA